jgi:hypothetical protein
VGSGDLLYGGDDRDKLLADGGSDRTLLGHYSPGGKAYGLDMTDEMLALAEKNKAESWRRTASARAARSPSPLCSGYCLSRWR